MALLDAWVAATKSWVERAGSRMNAASLSMDSGTYDSQALLRDAFRSTVSDPMQWYLDLMRLTDTSQILIDTRVVTTASSQNITVRNPAKTTITPMIRAGANDTMAVGTDVFIDGPTTPAPHTTPAGTVAVRLNNVGGFANGVYVGYLIDDTSMLACVIALR